MITKLGPFKKLEFFLDPSLHFSFLYCLNFVTILVALFKTDIHMHPKDKRKVTVWFLSGYIGGKAYTFSSLQSLKGDYIWQILELQNMNKKLYLLRFNLLKLFVNVLQKLPQLPDILSSTHWFSFLALVNILILCYGSK